jgi:hypothetical protein
MKRRMIKSELETASVVVPPELQSFKAYLLRWMLPELSISKGNLLKQMIDEYISTYCR